VFVVVFLFFFLAGYLFIYLLFCCNRTKRGVPKGKSGGERQREERIFGARPAFVVVRFAYGQSSVLFCTHTHRNTDAPTCTYTGETA